MDVVDDNEAVIEVPLLNNFIFLPVVRNKVVSSRMLLR